MKRLIPLLALLVIGAGFAGCGSKKSSNSSASTPAASTPAATTPAATSTPAAAPAAGGVVMIDMQNTSFSPKQVTAKVGQTLKWTNKDGFAHNVTATKGETFKSKDFSQNGTYSYKLDKAGTIQYVCTIHPGMGGTITVTA